MKSEGHQNLGFRMTRSRDKPPFMRRISSEGGLGVRLEREKEGKKKERGGKFRNPKVKKNFDEGGGQIC